MQEVISLIAQAAETATPEPESRLAIPTVTSQVEADGVRLSEYLTGQPDQTVHAVDPASFRGALVGGQHTIGEKILTRLDALGAQFRTNIERTHKILEAAPKDLTVSDLLKLQLETAQISLEIELVGKGVSKCVQHVDQLTRLQ